MGKEAAVQKVASHEDSARDSSRVGSSDSTTTRWGATESRRQRGISSSGRAAGIPWAPGPAPLVTGKCSLGDTDKPVLGIQVWNG